MAPGTHFREEIDRQLTAATCVVVLWSANSVEDNFVLDEADEALKRGVLIQAVIEAVKPPKGFRQHHWATLVDWNGEPQAEQLDTVRAGVLRLCPAIHQQGSTTNEEAPKPPPNPRRYRTASMKFGTRFWNGLSAEMTTGSSRKKFGLVTNCQAMNLITSRICDSCGKLR